MTFHGLSPLAGLILALGTLGVLTAAHFLHRRYQRVTVPTLRFWSAALKRHRQDTLSGRWRSPLTWLLLCLLAGLLILGMLQPALSGSRGPTPYVLIVDCRASMALSNEAGVARLEQARSLGGEILQDVAGPTGITLVAVDNTARVLAKSQDPKAEALHQLKHLDYAKETTDAGMDQALELAAMMVEHTPHTEVVVLTDHSLAAYDLAEPLLSQCHVLNLSEPVDNVAVLPPHAVPQPDGTYRLEVSLAFWGDQPCEGKLMLTHDDSLRDSQRVSLAPGQVQSYDFTVGVDEIAETTVYMLCDEAFAQDNRTPHISWRPCRVFLPAGAPLPLKAAVAANPAYRVADSTREADVCLKLAAAEATASDTYQAVQITPALCPDASTRQSWMVDLYTAGPNVAPVATDETAIIFVQTADGQPLAVRSNTSPAVVTLSSALFDEQATFWKQPQFLPILDAMLRPVQEASQPTRSLACYSDLSQAAGVGEDVSQLAGSGGGISLTQCILWVVLGLGLLERLLYYRGRIV